MRRFIIWLLLAVAAPAATAQPWAACIARIERIEPFASAFVSAREVQVWLPPGYDADAPQRYPVLYLHDGQNVFETSPFGLGWQVGQTAARLIAAGELAPLIIVAVANNADRLLDYTPDRGRAQSQQGQPAGGGAANYGRYLVQELKPLIDSRYRTQPARSSTAVGGSSLGGLVSMWLLLEHEPSFGAALVVSPAVWWADSAILARVAQHASALAAPRIWLDIGELEGEEALRGARQLHQALIAKGWTVGYAQARSGHHNEAAWAQRVAAMLRHIHGLPVSAR